MTEVEAKFLIEWSAQSQQLIDAMQSCEFELQPVGSVDVVDRYFDTPGWKLLRSGWTYRWRDTSGKRQLTLKSIGTADGTVHRREEVEQEVSAFPAHGDRVPAGPVAECLATVRQDKLRELFRVHNHRQLFHVRTSAGALIEVALDHVTATSSESFGNLASGAMEFAELELELKEGSEDALQHLAETMQQRLNLLPARLSKFQRSLRPLGLRPPRALRTAAHGLAESAFLRQLRKWPLGKKDGVIELAYRCLLDQFEALLSEEPSAWEGLDAEGVHQMRVATRRIRAALRAFKSVFESASRNEFNREFKWLARVLGSVRDLDIHQDNLRRYTGEISVEQAACLDDYQQHLAKQWQAARNELLDCLSSARYRTLKSSFTEFLQRGPSAGALTVVALATIRDDAVRLIGKQYKSVLRHGRSITQESPHEELHALRIDCKRLRYLFEFFRDIYGTSLTPFIKRLKTLQDVLGEFQDAQVARSNYCNMPTACRCKPRTAGSCSR
jgi:CHAD domain-containing protein/adenylate cyclase class IV